MKYFIILNGKEVRTIQAENLEDARNNAINYCDHSNEIIVREFEPKKTYYLFGEDAIIRYDENGIEGVLQNEPIDEYDNGFSTFEFVQGFTSSSEILNDYDGWCSYQKITKDEYEKLNSIN